jgi:hypothetical protein
MLTYAAYSTRAKSRGNALSRALGRKGRGERDSCPVAMVRHPSSDGLVSNLVVVEQGEWIERILQILDRFR